MGNGMKPILCIKSNNFIDKGTKYWCSAKSEFSSKTIKFYVFVEKEDKSPLFHCDLFFLEEHFIYGANYIRDSLIDEILS